MVLTLSTHPHVQMINGPVPDPCQSQVQRTYAEDPELRKMVIGPSLWFQFGIYDTVDPADDSLDVSGRRRLERQLELADLGVFLVNSRRRTIIHEGVITTLPLVEHNDSPGQLS